MRREASRAQEMGLAAHESVRREFLPDRHLCEVVGAIDQGLLALVGIEPQDDAASLAKGLHRLLNYRVFADPAGKMNLSLKDVGGGLLLAAANPKAYVAIGAVFAGSRLDGLPPAAEALAACGVPVVAGDSGGAPQTALYFELRRNGQPVDPRGWWR